MLSRKLSIFDELKRRHVYRVGAMYAVAGWLLVQVITQVLPIFDISSLIQRILVLLIVAGFPLALVLAWIFDLTPEGFVRTDSLAPDEQEVLAASGIRIERRLNFALAAMLAIALTYFVIERSAWVRPKPAAAPSRQSIAVLPFENLSSDAGNAYFATGMQEEILTRLSALHSLRVISHTSTDHYQSRPDDLDNIGHDLGVEAMLEGSVQKIGDAVHINVQLIEAATQTQLWAQSYDRTLQNVFAVEGEVAQAVADSLHANLLPAETAQLATTPTANAQAYDDFLNGEYHLQRDLQTENPRELDVALNLYQSAVDRDPHFALAYTQLAFGLLWRGWAYNDHRVTDLDRAKTAIDQALALAPDLAAAHTVAGYYHYWGERDYAAAEAEFHRALMLSPQDSDAHYALALLARRRGLWSQASAEMMQAIGVDPRNTAKLEQLGELQQTQRDYHGAEETYQRVLALEPGDSLALRELAGAYLFDSGDTARAITLIDAQPDALRAEPGLQLMRSFALAIAREFDSARANLSAIKTDDPYFQRYILDALGAVEIAAGHPQAATEAFSRLHTELQPVLAASPDDVAMLELMAAAEAGLGHADEAIRAGRRAVELLPVSKDAYEGPDAMEALAEVYAQLGRSQDAVKLLDTLMGMSAGHTISLAILEKSPFWDNIRGTAEFQALLKKYAAHLPAS